MQCFQKDPNLRVSARKLLKHPWIVNAKRSDTVVPKKPTEYEEAVKSVQQWNEALKSPNAGSLRRISRPMSSSPIPARRDPNNINPTPARGPLSLAKPRMNTEQFRSPSNSADDNWDDDFTSAISLSSLRLPHLRPHDNFGGLLSSEKLKAFASFETVTEETNWDDNFEGELTARSALRPAGSDPLETIRPFNPKRNKAQQSDSTGRSKSPEQQNTSPISYRRSSAVHQRQVTMRASTNLSPVKAFEESFDEDLSNSLTQNLDQYTKSPKKVGLAIYLSIIFHV